MGIFSRSQTDKTKLTKLENQLTQEIQQRELSFLEWDERIAKLERTINAVVEEIDSRIDRGNKIWRQIRARERREAELAELEGEPDSDQRVFDFDGEGSQPEEMRGMSPYVATPESPLQPHEEAAKAIALSIARRGMN